MPRIGDVQKELRKKPIKTIARKPAVRKPTRVVVPAKKPVKTSMLEQLVQKKNALKEAGRAYDKRKYGR